MAAQDQPNRSTRHRVSLNGFARFVSAGASGRLDCVREQISIYEGEYRATAFYKDFTEALIEGRRAGTDELSLQRCVSHQSNESRRNHYAQLRQHWLSMPRLHLPLLPVRRTLWELPSLEVTIAPEFGLQRAADGPLLVKLWLQKDPPGRDAIQAIHWLLARHVDALLPSATPVLIDLRREKVHEQGKRPYKYGYEHLITSEAASMASLWERLTLSA